MRRQVGKNELKDLGIDYSFDKKKRYSMDEGLLIEEKEVIFFEHDGRFAPTLKLLLRADLLRNVIVDMGAVRFLASGADVMRPGIREIEEFNQGDFVVVKDEKNKKPLAVCIALHGSEDLRKMATGKVLKNIHYVGDKIWNLAY